MKKNNFNKNYGLSVDKYKKINNIIKKYNISKFELITNYGLYSGDTNLYKTLTIYDLIKRIKNIKGEIIEFGVWNGNTSLLIKKILDIYKIKKTIYLFDHFKGLTHYSKNDPKNSLKWKNKYKGRKSFILEFVKFFKLKTFVPNNDDAFRVIKNNMVKNGLIVFDQANDKNFSGEAKAMEEFFQNNRKAYNKIKIPFSRQPDVILQKKK